MKMEQSVPKRRHITFRRRGISQKKAYNIQNKAKVWNQYNITDAADDDSNSNNNNNNNNNAM